MFKSASDDKLKANLRLCISRLKLLEKKKTEISLKSRKEIADYLLANKLDRARIKVEQIIREDYLVEAMEIVEMFCDLLLSRFGLYTSQSQLDPSLEEAVSTLIWVTPRLQSEVAEFKTIQASLSRKYGTQFMQACLANQLFNVNEKVMQKLNVAAPPCNLVEMYLVEIAKSFEVPFEPDPWLIDGGMHGSNNGRHGGKPGGGNLISLDDPPELPSSDLLRCAQDIGNFPAPAAGASAPYPHDQNVAAMQLPPLPLNPPVTSFHGAANADLSSNPPAYEEKADQSNDLDLPELPTGGTESNSTDGTVDVDDLSQRFHNLVNKK